MLTDAYYNNNTGIKNKHAFDIYSLNIVIS